MGAKTDKAKKIRAAKVSGAARLRRTWAKQIAGGLTGVVLLGSVAVFASGYGSPAWTSAVRPITVPEAQIPPGTYQGVCPGPLTLADDISEGTDPEFSPVSETAKTAVSATVLSDLTGIPPASSITALGSSKPLKKISGTEPSTETGTESPPPASNEDGLTQLKAAVERGVETSTATVVTAQPQSGQESTAKGVMGYTASDGDLRGLAVSNCRPASNDFWLVGAGTTVGVSSILTLRNPQESPATVNLELHGADGPLQAAGSRGLLIGPGESRSVNLAGLAANQQRLAVHVQSTGGAVAGSIQHSVLRGLNPGGVERIQAAAPSSTTQVVTGIRVQDPKVTQKISSKKSYASVKPELQVVVPGATDAVLDIRVSSDRGPVELPGGGVVTAPAGATTHIPLDSLPEGVFTAEVSSDVSIVATARVTNGTKTEEPVDTAWVSSSARLGSQHLLVFPAGVDATPTLAFGAPDGRAEIRLTGITSDGKLLGEKVIGIAGETTVTVSRQDIAGDEDIAAVMISASGDPVYGSQILRSVSGPGLSIVPVPETSAGRQSVKVTLGY
ncbi:DUF5719 family protein [Arthrobacter roseus]|uniref:DUF5719 family protein n=1 Tax=Arthrobacter roseus TaxID=136274 RepID=UPI0019635E9C|nr:hypothetical protein [Arthrobacter roseus]